MEVERPSIGGGRLRVGLRHASGAAAVVVMAVAFVGVWGVSATCAVFDALIRRGPVPAVDD